MGGSLFATPCPALNTFAADFLQVRQAASATPAHFEVA